MSRLLIPFEAGTLAVPDGRVLYLNAQIGAVPTYFDDITNVQDMWTVYSGLPATRVPDVTEATGPFSLALLDITRDRDCNRGLIAEAWLATEPGGVLVLSGAKTDGIDALTKELRKIVELDGVTAKSHGKVLWLTRTGDTPDIIHIWRAKAQIKQNKDGFATAPGMFSHDHVDPGSKLLIDVLPPKLGAHVVDLGAGWGWLSAQLLARPNIERLDLVEASAASLKAAKANVQDQRARFIWTDAKSYVPEERLADAVVMNPPFHVGRASEPSLGQAFITAATRCLKPNGALYLVANRHLPYEAAMQSGFRSTDRLADLNGFKVLAGRGLQRKSIKTNART